MKSIWPRCHVSAHESGTRLSTLLPSDIRYGLPLLEDISLSESVKQRVSVMRQTLEHHREWLYISLDATLRSCMKLTRRQRKYAMLRRLEMKSPGGASSRFEEDLAQFCCRILSCPKDLNTLLLPCIKTLSPSSSTWSIT